MSNDNFLLHDIKSHTSQKWLFALLQRGVQVTSRLVTLSVQIGQPHSTRWSVHCHAYFNYISVQNKSTLGSAANLICSARSSMADPIGMFLCVRSPALDCLKNWYILSPSICGTSMFKFQKRNAFFHAFPDEFATVCASTCVIENGAPIPLDARSQKWHKWDE